MNNSQYSYATRGTDCVSITPSLTNNKKFLHPGECIYNKQYKTFLYPSTSFPTGNFSKSILIPEQAKAYYIPFGPKNNYTNTIDENKSECCGNKRNKNFGR